MEDEEKTGEGGDIDETEKLMDWLLSTELTWAVLILTCFIGLIELLPEIRYYGSSHGDVGLTCLLALVALALVGGCIFSIDKFARLTNTRVLLEQEFSETIRKTFYRTKGGFIYNVLFKMDKAGNLLHLRRWVTPLISSVFALVWILIIVLKIL